MVLIEFYFTVFFFFLRGTSKVKLPVPLSKPSSAFFEMLSNLSLFNQTFCPSHFKHFRTHHRIFSDIEQKSCNSFFPQFTFCFRIFFQTFITFYWSHIFWFRFTNPWKLSLPLRFRNYWILKFVFSETYETSKFCQPFLPTIS